MTAISIRSRLLWTALLWIAVAWSVGGTVLTHESKKAVRQRFDVKIGTLLNSIAGAVEFQEADGNTVVRVRPLNEPRFTIPESGWYWQIKTSNRFVLRSASLEDTLLPLDLSVTPGETLYGNDTGPKNIPLRSAQTAIEFPTGLLVVVKVALADDHVQEAIRDLKTVIHFSLGIFGIGLAAALLLQIYLGLHPLHRMSRELERLAAGDLEALSDNYPREISFAVKSINALIARNQNAAKHTRTTASNLGHALKTELALIQTNLTTTVADREGTDREGTDQEGETVGEVASESGISAQAVANIKEHIGRIAQIIDHHLNRGANPYYGIMAGGIIDTAVMTEEICKALNHIFAEQAIVIDCHIDGRPTAKGERQDFGEMFGNLIENACKHAENRVVVSLTSTDTHISLRVEDDGVGMTEAKATLAVKRGKRLDERNPGSGLGLSIVADLAEMYQGTLDLSSSALGGLAAELTIPVRTTTKKNKNKKMNMNALSGTEALD